MDEAHKSQEELTISTPEVSQSAASEADSTTRAPKTMAVATAMTIAQMQKLDDGAIPKRDTSLLDTIDDFTIDSEDAVEITIHN